MNELLFFGAVMLLISGIGLIWFLLQEKVVDEPVIVAGHKAILSNQLALPFNKHAYGLLVPTDKQFPDILLDSLKNDRKISSSIGISVNQKPLLLEGDFPSTFQVYVSPKFSQEALYLLPPDVMSSLIDNGEEFDIFLHDNVVYIFTDKKEKDVPGLRKQILEFGEAFITQLDHEIKTFDGLSLDARTASRLSIVPEESIKLGTKRVQVWMLFVLLPLIIGLVLSFIPVKTYRYSSSGVLVQTRQVHPEILIFSVPMTFIIFMKLWPELSEQERKYLKNRAKAFIGKNDTKPPL